MSEPVVPKTVWETVGFSASEERAIEVAEDNGAVGLPVVLDLVEYYPSTRGDDIKHKHQVEYLGVVERASDGFCVLRVRAAGASRAHQMEVGDVYAISVHGRRSIMQTPRDRWKIRAQEIKQLVEGEVEEWAKPYFDPASDKWFKRAPDYRDETDDDGERKYRRLILGEQPPGRRSTAARPQAPAPAGCAVFLVAGVGLLSGGLLQLINLN